MKEQEILDKIFIHSLRLSMFVAMKDESSVRRLNHSSKFRYVSSSDREKFFDNRTESCFPKLPF